MANKQEVCRRGKNDYVKNACIDFAEYMGEPNMEEKTQLQKFLCRILKFLCLDDQPISARRDGGGVSQGTRNASRGIR